MKSKFEVRDNRPMKEKIADFLQSLLFWRGRKRGMIHTRNLEWGDIREIFFPQTFEEKYGYLGSVPYREDSDLFKVMYPLILAMDYEAKPKWCPRWVLRFLCVFGADKSIVRVRNRFYNNLLTKLTKGILIWDYKTKWEDYDLRISVSVPKHLQELADDIERGFYSRGRQDELVNEIKKLDPNAFIMRGSVQRLETQLEELEKNREESLDTKEA